MSTKKKSKRANAVVAAVSGSEATLRRACLDAFRAGYKYARKSDVPFDDISELAVRSAFTDFWSSRNDR